MRMSKTIRIFTFGVMAIILGTMRLTVGATRPDDVAQKELKPLSTEAVTLDQAERNQLLYLREKEKLTRDVYRKLHDKWQSPIFKRIADTQQRNFESMGLLVEWYNLKDPAGANPEGVYSDAALREKYTELVNRGESSATEALYMAAQMEEKDVSSMLEAMVSSRHWDILVVYETLMGGSRSSLESLVEELQFLGHSYRPQLFTESEFYALVGAGA